MNDASEPNRFDFTLFLLGRKRAYGIVEDRFGRMRRKFSMSMHGHWSGDAFLLDESFTFEDGETGTRTWRVTPGQQGRFTATCQECVGVAEGHCIGDTIQMFYRFRLKINNREMNIDFDDRTHRVQDGIALNRATMRKWGIRVGELWVVFVPEAAQATAVAA